MILVMITTMVLMSFLLSIVSEAHTWIDCIDTNRSKLYDQSALYIFGGASCNGFCQGYGAGYPGRGDHDIGREYTHKMLRNEVEAGTSVCKNVDANAYSDWRKRISLVPGQTAYFAYLPNGHIVKDKKAIGTQHGVYWTGQAGTSLSSTLDMTPEHLLNGHTMDYDDGNCGESLDRYGKPGGRAGDGKPCVGTFTIPVDTVPGIYKMVWYWTFWLDDEANYVDQIQASGYFGAAYSTCFEVEVISDESVATQTELAPAVTPASIAPIEPLPPRPIVEAAAPNSAAAVAVKLDVGTVAPAHVVDDSDDDDLPPLNYSLTDVATVHGAKQSSSDSPTLVVTTSDDGEIGQFRQEELSPLPASSLSLRPRVISSVKTQSSSANYIKTSEGWLVLGIALLLGVLV